MRQSLFKFTAIFIAALLMSLPVAASASMETETEEKDIEAGKMAADAIVVRPLGLAATIIGGGLFVISLPFSALGGNTKEAYKRLLEDPAVFTFKRPLGDFD